MNLKQIFKDLGKEVITHEQGCIPKIMLKSKFTIGVKKICREKMSDSFRQYCVLATL